MKKNKVLMIIAIILIIMLFLSEKKVQVSEIEDKEMSAGVGFDLSNEGKENYGYSVLVNGYFFFEDLEVKSGTYRGTASTIGKTRDERAVKMAKEFFLGLEKTFIIEEHLAKEGIRPILDILFSNPVINDSAYCVISKGSTFKYLNYKIEGFASTSDYLEGLMKHMENFNFFKEEYKVKDMFLIVDSEGRNLSLPYLELKNEGLMINGLAIFNKEKLATVLDIDKTKVMNILKNESAKGMLTIQKNQKEYINYYGKTKRTVKCSKQDDKYKFIIEIGLNGDVVNNTLYKGIDKKIDVVEKFQKDMEKTVEAMCNDFLANMKENLKIDCLELGRIAAAKYGRDTGIDWNKIICDSEIKVKVKVKVDKVGRGQY